MSVNWASRVARSSSAGARRVIDFGAAREVEHVVSELEQISGAGMDATQILRTSRAAATGESRLDAAAGSVASFRIATTAERSSMTPAMNCAFMDPVFQPRRLISGLAPVQTGHCAWRRLAGRPTSAIVQLLMAKMRTGARAMEVKQADNGAAQPNRSRAAESTIIGQKWVLGKAEAAPSVGDKDCLRRRRWPGPEDRTVRRAFSGGQAQAAHRRKRLTFCRSLSQRYRKARSWPYCVRILSVTSCTNASGSSNDPMRWLIASFVCSCNLRCWAIWSSSSTSDWAKRPLRSGAWQPRRPRSGQ